MFKFNALKVLVMGWLRWAISRVAVIYGIVLIFCFMALDLKMLDTRFKIRHLNSLIPDFSDIIIFAAHPKIKNDFDWKPYQKYFRLIIRYMPDDLVAKQWLGYADYYAGQDEEAIDQFKKSLRVADQSLFWSHYNLGVINYKKGLWAQAAAYLLESVQSNPTVTMLLMQHAMIYSQLTANSYFKSSLMGDIKDAKDRAYLLLVSSLYHLGAYDKMMVVVSMLLSRDDFAFKDALYYYAGLACVNQHLIQKAFLFFQKSLSIEKNNPEVYDTLAFIYQKAGQEDQARYFGKIANTLYQKHDPRFPYTSSMELSFF